MKFDWRHLLSKMEGYSSLKCSGLFYYRLKWIPRYL